MSLEKAVAALRAGELVVFPTETVYGLGADASNPLAVARIYQAKGRPRFNPLIAHVSGLDEALEHAALHPTAIALAEKFWPGPLTIVAPRSDNSTITELACAGLSTVALRAPSHPLARALIAAFGEPIAAPSANRSGRVSATTIEHAREELGDAAALFLDGGPCKLGLESTIVTVNADGEATLLRPGAVTRAAIEAVTDKLAAPVAGAIAAPGMLESHYAPRARLRLDADAPRAGEAYLAFGAEAPADGLSLSPTGDLVEAAANLYAHLRTLDAAGAETIAVAPIPSHGLGEAIRDRLARAAAPR